MEQQTPLLSVSFLPTKQDYADYQIAACNAAASPGERLFLRAAGFVLVVAGFVLCLLFGVGNPQNTVFFSLLVLLGLAVGLTLGIIAAWKHNSGIDYFTMVIAVLGVSVPNFVVAALLQYYVGLQWKILPVAFWTSWACSVLPSIALSFSATAMFARFIRTEMLDVLEQDYITTARAKGLSQFKVLMVHAVRNSIIPVVTILGPVVVNLLTGSLAVESIYSVPGIGSLFVDCIKNNDYSTIMGITVFYSAFYIFVIMVVDILYSVIDPRIRIQGSKEG